MDKDLTVGEYLLRLERSDNWNLRYDNIYISYTSDMFKFKKLKQFSFKDEYNNASTISGTVCF